MYADTAKRALRGADGPLHIDEIVKRAESDPRFKHGSKDPRASIGACIYADMKKNKGRSAFVQLKPAVFGLRDRPTAGGSAPGDPAASRNGKSGEYTKESLYVGPPASTG